MSHSHHSRSRSMPSELHPIATRIKLELKGLEPPTSSPMSAQTVCSALAGLQRLHGCAGELLRLPLAQQAFSRHRHEKWVAKELDGSIRLLDLSGTARDLLSSMKEQVRELASAVRRRGDHRGVEKSIGAYLQLRRRSQRDLSKCLAALKSIEAKSGSFAPPLEQNSELSILVRLLSEARDATVAIVCSVLSLMTTPKPQARPSKCSLFSRVMGGGRKVASDERHERGPKMESADALLSTFYDRVSSKDAEGEEMVRVQVLLAMMEARIEGVAAGLDGLFRQLIQNRVSLLNVLSP